MPRSRLTFVVIGVVAAAVVVALLSAAWVVTPGAGDLKVRLAAQERATRVRHEVPLQQVAPVMRGAIVATEDERFYSNHGVDLLGIARAIPYDIAHLSFAQGASTITDQLAKLLYLNGNDHSPWRKFEDLTLALKISTQYSKEQVLDAYLNSVYFGAGAYGIGAAAQTFFATAPGRLNLAQASLLAGLVQAPSTYDPFSHPLAARERQVEVLRSLVRDGYATSSAATRVVAVPLRLRGDSKLPALPEIQIRSQPALALRLFALGVAMFVAAVTTLVAARHRHFHHRAARASVRWACILTALAGLITVTNSFTAL